MSEQLRFAVTGGRMFGRVAEDEDPEDSVIADRVLREKQLAHLALSFVPSNNVLVHGDARGADYLCATLWRSFGNADEPHPADWRKHGKGAGPIRNQEMIDSGLDFVIAFPGGRGTADMVRRAERAGIPVKEYQ